MSILGCPVTEKAVRIYNKTVLDMDDEKLILNYISLDVEFKFPKDIKYPSIPTRVDDNIDIYPLEGRSTITGSEYLVAKEMGCDLFVKDGVMIPFEINVDDDKKEKGPKAIFNYKTPFRSIMKGIQAMRRLYEKYTFLNTMYKLIGNAIYGLISMGISGKKSFDIDTKSYVRVEGGFLSNPILSSYICGFTRALIGECLNNIHILGGKVVTVTTDGFITDIEDLEDKIMNSPDCKKNCLLIYKEIRSYLTSEDLESSDEALEVKHKEENGLAA